MIALAGAGCAPHVQPRKLTIAAAADLNFAMEEISRDFHKQHPDIDLQANYGSSGNFYSQIQNHAPFDVFLSADVDYPRRLAAEGLGVTDSLFVYAVGRIVVWVPAAIGPGSGHRAPGRDGEARGHRQSSARALRPRRRSGHAVAGRL